MKIVRISCLELARVAFPGGRLTSAAGQEYLRRLDRIFKPDAYRAKIERRSVNGYRVMSLDESAVFNVTDAELRKVAPTGVKE